jgi:hypothetical protein
MPFVELYVYFPEVAGRETRSITIPPGSGFDLPPDDYGFLELYCNERGCDCRRVLFYVVARSRAGVQAVIGWGWEDVDFYTRWMKHGDRSDATWMKGPALNPLSPATELAPALLGLVRDVLLKDPEYVERIKRHYAMVRERIDGPKRPGRHKPRKRR